MDKMQSKLRNKTAAIQCKSNLIINEIYLNMSNETCYKLSLTFWLIIIITSISKYTHRC